MRAIHVLGGDFWGYNVGPVTAFRCEAAIRVYKEDLEQSVVILTAGEHQQHKGTTAAHIMKRGMVNLGIPESAVQVSGMTEYNTLGEIKDAVRWLEDKKEINEVVIVSSYLHLPRCFFLWCLFARRLKHPISIRMVGVSAGSSNVIWETAAWLRLPIRLLSSRK
ncbi:MAG: YdcF family protein [Parcubacteria group bacterium]|nr:YdcF family protein [Parcubacteria group bacterium]